MNISTRTYKIYELDVYDALELLAWELHEEDCLPMTIVYQGAQDGHTVWTVEGYRE